MVRLGKFWAPLLTATLLSAGCGSDDGQRRWRDGGNQSPGARSFVPADPDAPYADVLGQCAHLFNRDSASNTRNDWCSLAKLPFLGQQTQSPTREQVLGRTLVSHPWMAERFAQLLDELPDDILLLMRSTTAVVIGAEIRPAHYWSATGAIYLDPAALWLTAEERNSISREPDYRSNFGKDLAFSSRWRYVKDNNYAWPSYSLQDDSVASRPLAHIVQPMARLLFHELAHAADFVPSNRLSQLNSSDTPAAATGKLSSDQASRQLASSYPLQSDTLFDLAQVMFNGESANGAQQSLSAEQVGLEFAEDGANDDYAYFTIHEDLAMLIEEIMMLYHFDTSREVGYTDTAQDDQVRCEELTVRWGVRHRIGDPRLRPRLELALQLLLDTQDVSQYLAALPQPKSLVTGVDWCTNLALFGTDAKPNQAAAQKAGTTLVPNSLDQQRPDEYHLPHTH